MGYIEVPDWLYKQIFNSEVSALSGMGFTPDDARREALIRMGRGFVARSTAEATEREKDHEEYIEDMSLGGQRYEP